jgi:hypothetical protein
MRYSPLIYGQLGSLDLVVFANAYPHTIFTAGCSEVGPIHYEQLTLGPVLKPRGPCAEDRGGPMTLQPAVGEEIWRVGAGSLWW